MASTAILTHKLTILESAGRNEDCILRCERKSHSIEPSTYSPISEMFAGALNNAEAFLYKIHS